jgi:V/A-type H+-transporting ATPase subunit I
MAIERMKKVTAVVPADDLPALTEYLHQRAVLHLTSVEEELPESFQTPPLLGGQPQEKAERLEEVMSFCESWGGQKPSFLASIFSAKPGASEEHIREAAARVEVDALHEKVEALRSRREELLQKLSTLDKEAERLRPFASVELPLGRVAGLRHVRLQLVRVPRPVLEQFAISAPKTLAWEVFDEELTWLASPLHDEQTPAFLSALGLAAEELPSLESPVRERLREITVQKAELQEQLSAVEADSRRFAAQAPDVELALGYWQSEQHRSAGLQKVLSSPRIGVLHGYLPARELPRLAEELRSRFSGELLDQDPAPGDAVPVKLVMHPFFRPIRMLVDMFGVPDYFSIDPTPFVAFTFLMFFGICFGDTIYGLALIILSFALRRKFRYQENLRAFFQLFLYCGVSTMVFGVLTGSWLGDLSDAKYLGPDNILLRIKHLFPYFEPLTNPILALVATIGIGIANQFYGIGMLMLKNLRRGDVKGALFDGALWYLYLGGLVVLVIGVFAPVPALMSRIGLYVLAAGALGLLLTQGRDQPTLTGKATYGLISLYGIMGSYGATGFISDTLSYSRLLALGLTTSIIGMAFNIIAGIVGGLPYIGILLFIAVILFGHTFNFFMSIIGSFVHPTRLILLEFFGRFYEMGGIRYRPFGFTTERIEVVRDGGR